MDYFQLANEVQDWFDRSLTPDQYGEAAQITLEALRSANPNAQIVMMGGFARGGAEATLEDRYKQAIEATISRGIRPAAIDIHWWFWPTDGVAWQSPVILDARAYLDALGLQGVQIWSMENGAWAGCPAGETPLTEEEQALILVKRYVWGRANGIAKLFWQQLIDAYNFSGQADSIFNSMGLVDDGEQNCADITRRNTQRIAYWSYRQLAAATDNLVATPSGTVSGTHDGSSVFAYQYTRRSDSSPLYIVWREGGTGDVTLNVPGSQYQVTNLIPDRFGNFQESDLGAVSGNITVSAGFQPLLIAASADSALPGISTSPAGKDFGIVNSGGSSAAQTFTVTNAGAGSITISGVSITGTDAGQFIRQTDACSGQVLSPSGTCPVEVAFSPTASGAKTANLAIASNDPAAPIITAVLTGTGVQYALTVTGAQGSSAGTVTGGSGINCAIAPDSTASGACTEMGNPGSSTVLTATPAADASVVWTNCTTSYGNTCTVTLNADTTITVVFNILPPETDFTAAPVTGPAPLSVAFTDLTTNNPAAWSWDFDNDGIIDSTAPNPTALYETAGTYSVTLTATNAGGSSRLTKTDYLTVAPCSHLPARLGGASPIYYRTLQEAYNAALDGDAIEGQAVDFPEDLSCNQPVTVTLAGGYDCGYTAGLLYTTISGSLTVRDGTVKVNNVIIKPLLHDP